MWKESSNARNIADYEREIQLSDILSERIDELVGMYNILKAKHYYSDDNHELCVHGDPDDIRFDVNNQPAFSIILGNIEEVEVAPTELFLEVLNRNG